MKKIILAVVWLAAVPLLAQQNESPKQLRELRQSYLRARAAAVAPVEQRYEEALTQMKERLTKAGDLEGAIAVDNELKALNVSKSADTTQSNAKPIDRNAMPKDAYRGRRRYYLGVDLGRDITWEEAKAACDDLGGRLVCLNDAKKLEEVLEYRKKAKIGRFWTGGTRLQPDQPFQWIDGTPFTPVGTPKDETQGARGGLSIDLGNGWTFFKIDQKKGTTAFICEWPLR
jgi:hypothetical protein